MTTAPGAARNHRDEAAEQEPAAQVRRYVNDGDEKSDAVVCAYLCPILPARGWGIVWLLLSLGIWVLGVYGLLAVLG